MTSDQVVVKRVVCPDCGETFVPTDFTVLAVSGYPSLRNVGLGCPHCGWFGHLFVEDMRIRRRRATLALRRRDWERRKTPGAWRQVEKAKEELSRVFDEVQAKWRPVLGLTPIEPADEAAVGPEATQ